MVTNAEGYTVGIISERDIVRALGEKESAAFETPVAEIMTGTVVFPSPPAQAGILDREVKQLECLILRSDRCSASTALVV